MMIQWFFSNNNIYLYKVKNTKVLLQVHTKLEFIKKFLIWPEQFNGGSSFLQILSPDFSQLLDPSKQEGCILIRDTITN